MVVGWCWWSVIVSGSCWKALNGCDSPWWLLDGADGLWLLMERFELQGKPLMMVVGGYWMVLMVCDGYWGHLHGTGSYWWFLKVLGCLRRPWRSLGADVVFIWYVLKVFILMGAIADGRPTHSLKIHHIWLLITKKLTPYYAIQT